MWHPPRFVAPSVAPALRKMDTMDPQPKALKYTETAAAVELKIAAALPEIVDRLIALAKDGDTKAAQYLIDRFMGKTADSHVAPVNDQKVPYSVEDFQRELKSRQKDRELSDLINGMLLS